MSTPFKLALAIVLAAGLFVFGKLFFQSYNEFTNRPDSRMDIDFSDNGQETLSKSASTQPESEMKSELATSPESSETPAAMADQEKGMKSVTISEPKGKETDQTNANAQPTKVSPQTKLKPKTSFNAAKPDTNYPAGEKPVAKGSNSKLGIHGAVFLGCLVGFGLLAGHCISQYLGQKAIKTIYNDEGEGLDNPGYDEAEQEWADGNHLEAIRLMRAYLTKNPRQQHVALRIAEIYEKDLKNTLAAALEYEEVLTKKLPPERWGWAAIHLCNLYYKLNKADKAFLLLKRIDAEYGHTAAAAKARKRLALIEAGGEQPPPIESVSDEA